MKFHRAEPSFHYRALRLLSGGGNWELGMSPYSHGVRLRMGRTGRPPSVLDVCMGHDERAFLPILVAVTSRLAPVAESASTEEIDAAFPWAGTRPDLAVHLSALLGGKTGV